MNILNIFSEFVWRWPTPVYKIFSRLTGWHLFKMKKCGEEHANEPQYFEWTRHWFK